MVSTIAAGFLVRTEGGGARRGALGPGRVGRAHLLEEAQGVLGLPGGGEPTDGRGVPAEGEGEGEGEREGEGEGWGWG